MAAVQRPAGVKRSQHIEFIDLKFQYAALKESIDARTHRVLDHWQYIMGPEVEELEERLATYTDAGHCATAAAGTEALLISLMAPGVKPDNETITTSFSSAATAGGIVLLGAKPVFVDIEPGTCNIDASRIEATVTPWARAIIPVDLYGQLADGRDQRRSIVLAMVAPSLRTTKTSRGRCAKSVYTARRGAITTRESGWPGGGIRCSVRLCPRS